MAGQPDPPNSENGTTVNGTPPLSSSSSTVTPSKEAMEEMDNLRNREINSKAISAILLLMLKYSKVARILYCYEKKKKKKSCRLHETGFNRYRKITIFPLHFLTCMNEQPFSDVLKFEYLCQLLVDSGCLLLILKMLGLQDITATVCAQSELEGCGFFQYCAGHSEQTITGGTNESVPLTQVTQNVATSTPTNAPSSASATIDNEQLPQSPTVLKTCWRNMFWSINFLRILQKLTKKKTHRIMLLVQYKSSAILKRILKVSHPMLELYTLKVLKSQVPYLGRKWRSSMLRIDLSLTI
ncbi:hypothetical protein BC938DRAFT_475404 [Jimgerdemannia flammicorona]|uniref:Far11/STRP C-terminal domain-containing protein n=1 Tax=Jimgerdemannia flammicorona TaxID=994334 RepID=A0A433PVJ3_9FUNG|nr:hypothetical protein BC938DRAFT_475404 [Jimgerdemannia flammicorona]